MVFTYVVVPNFSMPPPPPLYRAEGILPTPAPDPKQATKPAENAVSPVTDAPSEAGTAPDPAVGDDAAPEATAAPYPAVPNVADKDAAHQAAFSDLVELQLGDVVVNPFGAELVALNQDERVVLTRKHVRETMFMKGFEKSRSELLSGRLGLWAGLVAAMNIGPDVNLSIFYESKSDQKLKMDWLETRRIRVTEEYAGDVLRKSAAVQKQMRDHPSQPIYIVSGMKIAIGASDDEGTKQTANLTAAGGAAAKAIEGKLFEVIWARSRRESWKSASNFILAVQLRQVLLKKGVDLTNPDDKTNPVLRLVTDRASMSGGGAEVAGEEVSVVVEGLGDSLDDALDRYMYETYSEKNKIGGDEGGEEEEEEIWIPYR